MFIAILAFLVFVFTTVLYTVLGNMYHIKVNLVWLFIGSLFTSIGFVVICRITGG